MAAFHVAGEVSWTVASDALTRSRQFSTARRSASLTESLSAQSNLPRSLAAWISSARRLLVAMASTSVSVRASTSATFHAHESMASESCRFRSSSNSGMPEPTQPRVRLACSALARMSLACSNGVTANSFASANCDWASRCSNQRMRRLSPASHFFCARWTARSSVWLSVSERAISNSATCGNFRYSISCSRLRSIASSLALSVVTLSLTDRQERCAAAPLAVSELWLGPRVSLSYL
mmetsp:Transcript_45730/g.103052  ORF Transcript_45730/g.103052 Transcript_45730/m.103052 type:complete len:237 (-) Transcript_45730:350-1060(-)